MNLTQEVAATIGAAFLTGIAGPLIVQWYKAKQLKKKLGQRDSVAEEVLFSRQINQKIEDIKDKYQADRVWISQFHNGGYYYPTGRSIQKFSIFYEVTAPEVAPIKMMFQNIPVTLFSKTTQQIYDNNYIAIPDFKNPEVENYGLRYLSEETGCKSYYGFAIFCIENKLIGSLGLEYTKKKRELSRAEIGELEIEAAVLGGVIINYLKGH